MYKIAQYNWGFQEKEILMTNDLGAFCFLPVETFEAFRQGKLDEHTETYYQLKEQGFLFEDRECYVQLFSERYAMMKSCTLAATQLFILVLTDSCNQCCVYCQAGEVHTSKTSLETCRKAVGIAVQSPVNRVTIEFQGGEPTKNPEALYFTIPYAKKVFQEAGKQVDFAIATNLTDCDPKLLRFLIEEDVHFSTSLDGQKELHERNRPLFNHRSSYDALQNGLKLYRELSREYGRNETIGAIETTTRYSLPYGKEIVEEYLRNGMTRLYIRPLTPLGCAHERWSEIGYTAQEYLDFYCGILDEMLERCKQGEYVCESTASIYLTRILACQSVGHTEFRSPCGGAVGQMAVNYDGNVYTCDEGRMVANMGDPIFKLGSVDQTYRELIQAPAAHAVCTASCVEGLPFCMDCVYSPYCAVCPVMNYGIEGDLISHEKESYHCAISKGIIKFLFEKIRKNDPDEMCILRKWAGLN